METKTVSLSSIYRIRGDSDDHLAMKQQLHFPFFSTGLTIFNVLRKERFAVGDAVILESLQKPEQHYDIRKKTEVVPERERQGSPYYGVALRLSGHIVWAIGLWKILDISVGENGETVVLLEKLI